MTQAEKAAKKAYPLNKPKIISKAAQKICQEVYIEGYEQAEKETIERACAILYDFNKQMVEMFGAKAVLSCNQFTVDVNRFRKLLKPEEE